MNKICFFINLILLLCFNVHAQSLKDSAAKSKGVFLFSSTSFSAANFIKPLPDNYYYCHLGFFCKTELQLQKSTKLPLKIRLGSVEYCDKMEAK